MEDKNKIIAKNISFFRNKQKLSLSDLARQAGVSKGYLSQLESDQNISPSIEILFKLAGALGITIPDLIEKKTIPTKEESVPLPRTLIEAMNKYKQLREHAPMLASIKMRGKYPNTAEDWFTLYNVIKNTIS